MRLHSSCAIALSFNAIRSDMKFDKVIAAPCVDMEALGAGHHMAVDSGPLKGAKVARKVCRPRFPAIDRAFRVDRQPLGP